MQKDGDLPMKSNSVTQELAKSKSVARAYLRSLPLEEKIARLIDLQEQYYEMLKLCALNGGSPIPAK